MTNSQKKSNTPSPDKNLQTAIDALIALGAEITSKDNFNYITDRITFIKYKSDIAHEKEPKTSHLEILEALETTAHVCINKQILINALNAFTEDNVLLRLNGADNPIIITDNIGTTIYISPIEDVYKETISYS